MHEKWAQLRKNYQRKWHLSNLERVENLKQLIVSAKPRFTQIAEIHRGVHFAKEASFALQILQGNDYLAGIAMKNQDSLLHAVINIAAVGLSLNPVHRHAYLVPRKDKVCLDIGYLGLIHLAVEIGAIKWAKAEIVYSKDKFELRGLGVEPRHEFEPFGERGEMKGAYCVAKTHDGEYLVTTMTISEIYGIRDRSESWKSFAAGKAQSSPWKSDESEMIRKTVIKRASKLWPMTDTRGRFEKALEVSAEVDPMDFSDVPAQLNEGHESRRADQLGAIRTMLETLKRSEEKYLEHLTKTCRREIKSLEELTEIELTQAVAFLTSLVEKKKGEKNEVA
jgi:recombination protein RecT